MQRLSAPTRKEVDKAHQKHTWVDIGVPSLRNLFFVSRWRTIGWFILAASSLPLHLLYNSTIIAQTHAVAYNAHVVDPAFISGAPFDASMMVTEGSPYPSHLQSLQSNISSF